MEPEHSSRLARIRKPCKSQLLALGYMLYPGLTLDITPSRLLDYEHPAQLAGGRERGCRETNDDTPWPACRTLLLFFRKRAVF
jgi:hypothetical protein